MFNLSLNIRCEKNHFLSVGELSLEARFTPDHELQVATYVARFLENSKELKTLSTLTTSFASAVHERKNEPNNIVPLANILVQDLRGRPRETFSPQQRALLQSDLAVDEEELLFVEGFASPPPRRLDTAQKSAEPVPFSYRVKTAFFNFPERNHISYQLLPLVSGPMNQLFHSLHRLNPAALVPLTLTNFRLGFEHFHGKFLGKLFGSSPIVDWKFHFSVRPDEMILFIMLPCNRDIEATVEHHWSIKAISPLVENQGYPKLYDCIKPVLLKALRNGEARVEQV